MFTPTGAFSGFSVDDTAKAHAFYRDILGLEVDDTGMGLTIHLPSGQSVFAYPKPNHQPAAYTMLNLEVADIDEAVNALVGKGVQFEHYEGMHQDEKGIARGRSQGMGPDIAWLKDPAGNILAVLQQ